MPIGAVTLQAVSPAPVKGETGRLRFRAELHGRTIEHEGAFYCDGEKSAGRAFRGVKMLRFRPLGGGPVVYLFRHEVIEWRTL